MKKYLYRAISTALLFLVVSIYTQEGESVSKEPYDAFSIGKYTIIEQEKGVYYAIKGNKQSGYYNSVTRAIESIR